MVELNVEGAVAHIVFAGNGKATLLTIDVLKQLHNMMDRISSMEQIRSIVISSRIHNFFIGGADLAEISQFEGEQALVFARFGQSLFRKFERSQAVVIAAVDGYCMGGGLDLLLACDLRYATPASMFAHPGARIGIVTGFGGTVRLVRDAGMSAANELLYTGKSITAKQAADLGLINEVCVDPMRKAVTMAAKTAQIDRPALAAYKMGTLALQ